MSEARSPEPEPDVAMGIPHPHEQEPAEVIDFTRSGNERAVGEFFETLQGVGQTGPSGLELAARIETRLSANAGDVTDPLTTRLQHILHSADAFADDEVYEHKVEHDPVFQRLITILQTTKDRQRSLHDHRRAALKLAELRAAFPDDETEYDQQWQDVIDRLFI